MANEHEQTSIQTTTTPAEGANEGLPRGARKGPRASAAEQGGVDLEALKAELRLEMKAERDAAVAAIREEMREQLNDERAALHAQVDDAKREASEATQRARSNLKPADFGHTVLDGRELQAHERPSERRNHRPLPDKGFIELELVHGSFVGTTADRTYWPRGTDYALVRDKLGNEVREPLKESDSGEPALPGEVLRFDMANKLHRKTAQLLRDSGCAERA